jgi:hypothetical protein
LIARLDIGSPSASFRIDMLRATSPQREARYRVSRQEAVPHVRPFDVPPSLFDLGGVAG